MIKHDTCGMYSRWIRQDFGANPADMKTVFTLVSLSGMKSDSIFGCWLFAITAYMIADFGHGPCGHYADGVA